MPDRMWPLAWFRFDEAIPGREVDLMDDEHCLVSMTKQAAVETAHARGANLVAWWPQASDEVRCSCIITKVSMPLRWEPVPADDPLASIDENLWFEGACGEQDFLLPGSGHIFTGRMSAWCPTNGVAYSVSLSEMGSMFRESR